MGNISLENGTGQRLHFGKSEQSVRKENPLQLAEQLAQVGRQATEAAALAARLEISGSYGERESLSAEEIGALKIRLDRAAVDAMAGVFSQQDLCCLVSVGSEGAKEILHTGAAAPSLDGSFATHALETADCVSDPVEGTTAAAHCKPGAVSVVAFSSRNGLLPSQPNTYYMEKLFAPASLRGKVSLDQSPEQNIFAALETLRIPPKKLRVVILNRPRNQVHIGAAQKIGVDLVLIEAGDLMPGLLAVTGQGGAVLQMGSGGYEEGVIVATAAKARGAVGEGRVLQRDHNDAPNPVLRLDDLVPGSQESCVVSLTAITPDPWFHLHGAMAIGRKEPRVLSESLTITSRGVTHHPPTGFLR